MTDQIGQPMDRVDGRAKVTGAARFAAEYNEKNLAYGVVVPATIASGTIKTIDTTAAEKVPGVLLVFTHRNLPKLAPVKTFMQQGAAGENRMPLSGTEIYYAGQHIALVVANTFEAATQAAMLVKATYDTKPPRASLEKLQSEGKSVSAAHLKYLNPFPKNLGEVLAGFETVIVPEMNLGQLCTMIRAKYLVDAVAFSKVKGRPFQIREIVGKVEEYL